MRIFLVVDESALRVEQNRLKDLRVGVPDRQLDRAITEEGPRKTYELLAVLVELFTFVTGVATYYPSGDADGNCFQSAPLDSLLEFDRLAQ